MRKCGRFYAPGASGFSLVELMLTVGIAALLFSILLPGLRAAAEAGRKASCMSNLRELHLAFRMFADEHVTGLWPAKAPSQENFMFDCESLFPEYLDSLEVLFCPSDVEDPADFVGAPGQGWKNQDGSLNCDIVNGTIQTLLPPPGFPNWPFPSPHSDPNSPAYNPDKAGVTVPMAPPSDVSYIYTGWGFARPEVLSPVGSLLLAYGEAVADGKVDRDLSFLHAGNALIAAGTEVTIYRLRDGMSRFFITDVADPSASAVAESRIPVLWDNFGSKIYWHNHFGPGVNVLYMDGHVEFMPFEPEDEVLPMTRAMGEFINTARATLLP